MSAVLSLLSVLGSHWAHGVARRVGPRRLRQGGQATAEYALVLLGVATVALLLAAWAAKSGKIGQLFDSVIDQLISKTR